MCHHSVEGYRPLKHPLKRNLEIYFILYLAAHKKTAIKLMTAALFIFYLCFNYLAACSFLAVWIAFIAFASVGSTPSLITPETNSWQRLQT